ncbi:MAG: alpha/beta hydrolase [Xanthobacteraceae bacterium]|nr:alpha/beta hydrolase [Xanthobacteraceae bacterium]
MGEQTSGPIFVDQRRDGPGVSHIDPSDPAAPLYRLLAKMRSPVALRDIMIDPVRTGYIGKGAPIDPTDLPKSAAELYPGVAVSELAVPSPAGAIRCQVYRPPGSQAVIPMALYLHGGGFTIGRSEDTAYITSRMASENGVVVVSVNYRLAPEWPFPAGLDDCVGVLAWMQQHGASIGGDGARIAVAGDSAGGNFAAAIPIKARDEGLPAPKAVVMFCPITDFFFEDYDSFERLGPLGIVYDTAFIGFIRGAYLVHRKNWAHPHASPMRADLAAYPPALIVSGTHDPLVDDNRAFVARLKAAGRDAEHFVREGMPHGYYFFPGVFRQGDEAFAAIKTFLARAL